MVTGACEEVLDTDRHGFIEIGSRPSPLRMLAAGETLPRHVWRNGKIRSEEGIVRKSDVHVSCPSAGTWRVSQRGITLSMHRTQDAAVTRGKTEARRDGVDLVTHAR